jgi:hypothetical protein
MTKGWTPRGGHLQCRRVGLSAHLRDEFGRSSDALPRTAHGRALTPDVSNHADAGFLGSLLSNRADYLLSLRRELSDSLLVLEVTGPGPDYAVRTRRGNSQDGRVPSVRLNNAPSWEGVSD